MDSLTQETITKNSSPAESSFSNNNKDENIQNSLNDVNRTDNKYNTNSNDEGEVPTDSCVAFSMEEPFNINNDIFNLLMSNYLLHVIIIYLLLNLIIILGSLYIINKDIELLFIRKLLGITVYNILFKIIKMYSKFSYT